MSFAQRLGQLFARAALNYMYMPGLGVAAAGSTACGIQKSVDDSGINRAWKKAAHAAPAFDQFKQEVGCVVGHGVVLNVTGLVGCTCFIPDALRPDFSLPAFL